MADISREEIEAKFEREAAMRESMLVPVMAKLDIIIARLDNQDQRMDRQDQRIDRQDARADRLEQRMQDIQDSIVGLKRTIILTGISSVTAVLIGIAGFNAALLSNMTTSFESGKETGQWQSDIRKEAEENRKWREEMRKMAEQSERRMQENDQTLAEMRKLSAETRALLQDIKQERKLGRK